MPNKFTYTRLLLFTAIVVFLLLGRAVYKQISNESSEGPAMDQSLAQEPVETPLDMSKDASVVQTERFKAPLPDYPLRVTKKTFGTYVEPGNSPVSPEKFTGFHSAIDLETFENEQNTEVPFTAICDGKLSLKRMAQGYGGVVAQHCTLNGSPVLVVYGHISLRSVPFSIGDEIKTGERIGILGEVGLDTDNERKHLHLGIRQGNDLVISGYVRSQSSLSDFINPRTVLAE